MKKFYLFSKDTKLRPLILAIDFDHTIASVHKDYPENTEPNALLPGAKEVINWASANNCTIILWTCRTGKTLKQATDFLDKNEVHYDYVNENIPELDFKTSNKIFANMYIDDLNIGFKVDWKNIKKLIQKKLIIEEIIEKNKK